MVQLTREEKDEIIHFHVEEGESIDSLRARFKRGPLTIEKVLLDAGIEIRKSNRGQIGMDENLVKEIINLNNQGFTHTEIAKQLNISSATTVRNKLLSLGLYETRFPEITEEQKLQINELYSQGVSSNKIATRLNISKFSVLKFIEGQKKERFDYRTYDVDRQFFDNIDTQEKAYWLGVMFADGYNNEEFGYIRFGQCESNVELVHSFKTALSSTHPIVDVDREHSFYQITIANRHLSESLAKLGCIQAKTHYCDFPEIPEHLERHFIRGYFDGDGSIWTSNNALGISITGNNKLVEKIQMKLMVECNLAQTKLVCRRPETSPNIVEIRYGGRHQIARISEYLYSGSTCHFSLKFDKFNI